MLLLFDKQVDKWAAAKQTDWQTDKAVDRQVG